MRAINHALTGTGLAMVIGNPVISLPVALLSHFVLDAIPHHGFDDEKIDARFNFLLLADILSCGVLVLVLAFNMPGFSWIIPSLAAFLATSPDFMWLPRYLRAGSAETVKPAKNPILKFHSFIQWFQRPIGSLVELSWALAAIFILANLV